MDNKARLYSAVNNMKIVKNFAMDRQNYLNLLEYYSASIEVIFDETAYKPEAVARVRVLTRSFEDEDLNYKSFYLNKHTFEDDVAALDEHIKSLPNLKAAKQAVLMRQLEAVRESSDDLGLDFSAAITEIMESLSSNILEAPKGDVA